MSTEPWNQTVALACASEHLWPACKDDPACLSMPAGEGAGSDFAACVRKVGDEACPEGWPVRHLVYDNVDVERSCSPCACGAPAGGNCIVEAAITGGNACGGMEWKVNVVSDQPPGCVDVLPPGSSLVGKMAAVLTHEPGACEPSGGAPLVTVTLGVPMTLCCQAQH
jgi:hypothetical protein